MTGLLAALAVLGHAQGFHLKLSFTLTRTEVNGLLVMDVDAGERARALRTAVDEDRSGLLEEAEVARLEERLTRLVTRPLRLSISGAPVPVVVKDSKLSLREDRRASAEGLSVAILMAVRHPHAVSPGMTFEVVPVSPDRSHVVVEVAQVGVPVVRREVSSGTPVPVRIE